jgi:hypothetical protein
MRFSKETWITIRGFEGLYDVSSMGRVRSLPRVKTWKRNNVICKQPIEGRILVQKPIGKNKKYLGVELCDKSATSNKHKTAYVHRLVAEAFIPNPEGKKDVNHIDGNTRNNCVENLEWATRKENIDHAFRTGLNKTYGTNHPSSKLTEEQVKEIRKTYKKGEKGKGYIAISRMYGVSPSVIQNIIRGTSWKRA